MSSGNRLKDINTNDYMIHVTVCFVSLYRGLDELINLDATDYHLIPYVTGGLGRLIHLIREDKVPDLPGKNFF